jgi:hypothetical protein
VTTGLRLSLNVFGGLSGGSITIFLAVGKCLYFILPAIYLVGFFITWSFSCQYLILLVFYHVGLFSCRPLLWSAFSLVGLFSCRPFLLSAFYIVSLFNCRPFVLSTYYRSTCNSATCDSTLKHWSVFSWLHPFVASEFRHLSVRDNFFFFFASFRF